MSKDLDLQVEITYDDVCIERAISSKTTIYVNGSAALELTDEQVQHLYKALTAYVRADPSEKTPHA